MQVMTREQQWHKGKLRPGRSACIIGKAHCSFYSRGYLYHTNVRHTSTKLASRRATKNAIS